MRILYDCESETFKSPSATLVAGELCTLTIHVPSSCRTVRVEAVFLCDRDGAVSRAALARTESRDGYDIFSGTWSASAPDLYFYHFEITTENEHFRLFREGEHDTNMESGDPWQLSVVTDAFSVPEWAQGAVYYQIMPDRFFKSGDCDLTEKLRPFRVHESTAEAPDYLPDANGKILNNDFFGGNLRGIAEKLEYIRSLGVSVIYLNPIFMAFSSHRYDTCDYRRVDPMLGTERDFAALCEKAHGLGIRIVLDGVFSHTGSRSVYFDSSREFGGGAYSDPNSPYCGWYTFTDYPEKYKCWWDFDTLPEVRKLEKSYLDFIINRPDSVVEKWLGLGADGFRLDVVDELPDEFVLRLRRRIRAVKPDALLMGEVWEDASDKIAYGVRRRYFVDGELDSVMNYPLRRAILRFCRGEDDGAALSCTAQTLAEHYPPAVLNATMNLLGSHDVARVLTELAAPFEGSRADMARHVLTADQRKIGLARLRAAAFLQFTLPGSPSIYYGDEAGMEGCKDPFNRAFFPWGREDAELQDFFRALGKLKNSSPALRRGALRFTAAADGKVCFERKLDGEAVWCYVNLSDADWRISAAPLLLGQDVRAVEEMIVSPMGFAAVTA